MSQAGTIRVLAGVLEPPLLTTSRANIVEFRDAFGDLNALFCKHFSNDMWIFVNRQDPDWEAHLIRLGYLDSKITVQQLVQEVKATG